MLTRTRVNRALRKQEKLSKDIEVSQKKLEELTKASPRSHVLNLNTLFAFPASTLVGCDELEMLFTADHTVVTTITLVP